MPMTVLVIQYRLGNACDSAGELAAVEAVDVAAYEERDGNLKLLSSSPPLDRSGLLQFCIDMIRAHKASVVKMRVGDGAPMVVSGQTVSEILSGEKDHKDLLV
jgi:hypothetical protein